MVNIKQQEMEEETSLANMNKPEQQEMSEEEHQTTHESEEEGNNGAESDHLGHSGRIPEKRRRKDMERKLMRAASKDKVQKETDNKCKQNSADSNSVTVRLF